MYLALGAVQSHPFISNHYGQTGSKICHRYEQTSATQIRGIAQLNRLHALTMLTGIRV